MSDNSLLEELLDRWEDERHAGRKPDLATICKEHPEAIPLLQEKILAFEAMNRALEKHLNSTTPGSDTPADQQQTIDAGACVTTMARYRIVKAHAKGGLGEVVVAQDERLSRRVALKRMQSNLRHDPARRRRFLREAVITGQLDHPGIVSILNVGEDETGNPCYTMKFIEGETLAETVRRLHSSPADGAASDDEGKTPQELSNLRPLLRRFISVCNAVAYAHSQNIIHRDIKPANIMLGEFGATYVVDWGLARVIGARRTVESSNAEQVVPASAADTLLAADSATADDDEEVDKNGTLTRTGSVMGTPAFMSPEQASGDHTQVGPASDIYSLGATLYFILAARAPIVSGGDMEWIDQLRRGEFPKPSEIQPNVPAGLEAICLKAMSLNSSARYGTASEMTSDIEHWLADEPVSAKPESISERIARFTRRHRAWTQSTAAAIFVVALVATLFAVLLNTQKNKAVTAESKATMLAEEKSRLADQKSELAEREASARKTADEQSQLALTTLKSVVLSISRKLKGVAGASEVRQSLLKTSIDGLNRVARTLDTRTEADRNLMTAHNDIGRIYLLAGDVEGTDSTAEALKHYTQANEIALRLSAANPDDMSLQREMSVSYESMGDVQQQLGDLVRAEESYVKGLIISEKQIVIAANDVDFKRDVAFGYEKVGDIRLAREDVAKAKESYQRSHQLYSENVEAKPENAMLRRDLLVSQSKLGNIFLREGDLAGAAKSYRECIENCAALEAIPDSGSQPRDRSVMLNKLGSVLQKQSLLSEAADAYNGGLKIASQIAEADPTDAGAQRDLSISLNNVGDVQVLDNQIDSARTHFLRGLEIRRALAARDASSQVAQVDVAQSLLRLGELELSASQPEKAREYFSEAMGILTPLEEENRLQSAADQLLLETIQLHLQSQ